jgi:hypothetical protein
MSQQAGENRLVSWLPVRWTPPAEWLGVRSQTATERWMQELVSGRKVDAGAGQSGDAMKISEKVKVALGPKADTLRSDVPMTAIIPLPH